MEKMRATVFHSKDKIRVEEVARPRPGVGEGVVAEFAGPGEILIQTRNLAAFAGLLKPFFPSQGGGGSGFSFGD